MPKLHCELKKYEGQPVRIYTDDRRFQRGIVLESDDDAVKIIDRHGCIHLIEFCHITSVDEPQMRLCEFDFDDGDCEGRKCNC